MAEDGFTLTGIETAEKASKSEHIQVIKVALDKVFPNPYQPRKTFDEVALKELADSIQQYGVLQPLLVALSNEGKYLLIAGERRLRASQLAGLAEVPVIVSEYTEQQIAEIAMIENLQREDLHFLEEAEGYEALLNQFNLTQEVMAVRVGKKQSTIANKLRLLKLPVGIRKTIQKNDLTERHARALLKLKDETIQTEVLQTIVTNKYNVKQTEDYIDKVLYGTEVPAKKKKHRVIVNDVRIYLNSIKQIIDTINDTGIPATIEQEVEGEDVVVTVKIKNRKRPKNANQGNLF